MSIVFSSALAYRGELNYYRRVTDELLAGVYFLAAQENEQSGYVYIDEAGKWDHLETGPLYHITMEKK